METLDAAGALVLGLVVGWCFEHLRSEREKTEITQQMIEQTQSSEYTSAARCSLCISFIESRQPEQAVRLLTGPIAYYRYLYADSPKKTARTAKLLALIEELAKTNQAVALRIAEGATNYPSKAP